MDRSSTSSPYTRADPVRRNPYGSIPGERSRDVEERHEVVMDGSGQRVRAERWIRRIRVERENETPLVPPAVAVVAATASAIAVGAWWHPGASIPVALVVYGISLYLLRHRG